MFLVSLGKTVLVCVSLAFVYKFCTKKKKRETAKEIHEVIMFSHGQVELKKSKFSRCAITPSMDRLLYHLNSPRYTLDICMYMLTNMDLVNAVLKLHYRNVKIRVIVDADMVHTSGSNVQKLEKQGIPFRWMTSTNLMHHKFCLVDTSTCNTSVTPVVITGSLNWTNQALYGNWENVVVTSQEVLVRQYKAEFERLWTLFKPALDI